MKMERPMLERNLPKHFLKPLTKQKQTRSGWISWIVSTNFIIIKTQMKGIPYVCASKTIN